MEHLRRRMHVTARCYYLYDISGSVETEWLSKT